MALRLPFLMTDARLEAALQRAQDRLMSEAPTRLTQAYPIYSGSWGTPAGMLKDRPIPKLNTRRVRTLSERPIPRAAINTIKKEVSALKWDVRVKKHITKSKKHEKQITIARNTFEYPNWDDSCRSLIEQGVEDVLVGDFWSIERQWSDEHADHPLWLWPVDGATIQLYLEWDGDPKKPRYAQVPVGTYAGAAPTKLTDDELVYAINNKRSNTPFGYSPLEAAAVYIDWLLQTQMFAGKSAAHSVPKKLLSLGKTVDQTFLQAFRAYWKNEVEGQGRYPIIGQADSPEVLDLGPQGDDGLFLKWQEMLISVIAVSFDLNPQDLGMMFDSNRSNSVMQQAATKSGAIRPIARLVEEVFTRDILSYMGLDDLEFVFVDIEPTDVKTMANVYEIYVESDMVTLGQARQMIGEPLYGDWRDDVTRSEYLAKLGEQYPAPVGVGTPKPSPAGAGGSGSRSRSGGKGHGKSSGRPNGAVQRNN